MAQITFDQINVGNDNQSNVGFFNLKNDGDEAIVRIMHDSTASFDLVTTHPIKLGDKYRRVSCIRDPREPLENCPMCKSGSKVQQRMYIHLIQYTKDDQGKIIPEAKIWERSASYAVTIKNLIDEYGPLSDCIFKVRRNGKAGSMDTTYAILYGNPQVYRNEMYPKDESLFEGFSVIGTMVLDKNFEELSEFLATGAFPQVNNTATEDDLPYTYPETPTNTANNNFVRNNMVNPNFQETVISPITHQFTDATTTNAPIQRPVRYY